ncbi:MAG: hypothetical protein ACBR50_28235 [Microcoleus sp.]
MATHPQPVAANSATIPQTTCTATAQANSDSLFWGKRSSALLTIYFYQLWKQGMQPPEALQQAKDWLRELTNGKLGEWYAGELLPLLREAEFKSIFFFEMEASRLQENLDIIEEKPYEHPYH